MKFKIMVISFCIVVTLFVQNYNAVADLDKSDQSVATHTNPPAETMVNSENDVIMATESTENEQSVLSTLDVFLERYITHRDVYGRDTEELMGVFDGKPDSFSVVATKEGDGYGFNYGANAEAILLMDSDGNSVDAGILPATTIEEIREAIEKLE